MENDLAGKVALITGASSGIGAATAIHFAKLGMKLCLTGRDPQKLENVSLQCLEASTGTFKPLVIAGDVTEKELNEKLVANTVKHFGQLDVLVTSAGMLKSGNIETTTLEDYDAVMNINVRSAFYIQQLCVPHLEKTKGGRQCLLPSFLMAPSPLRIQCHSEFHGYEELQFPNALAYCISKSALDQLTRCTALELAPKQIRVNSVNPGVIETGLHMRGGMDDTAYHKFLEHSKTTHALGRVGQSEEVSSVIAFLASNAASYITGTQVPVDGGRGVMCPR